MNKNTVFVTAIITSLGFVPPAGAAISADDFVKKASIANEFEIESSKLALDKSQNKDIKLFAQHMVGDHEKIGSDMQTLLQSEKLSAKTEDNLDTSHQSLMKRLEGESGDTFNHDYVSIQLKAHKEAVSLFTDYSKNGSDSTLKAFAADTLPTLKEHLQQIEKIKARE